ncbi:hypothetical protein LLG96_11500 [bacterium]|nr:hypothetical protein [bacterium]
MDTLSIILAYFVNEKDNINVGRTLLQKKIFFLNELIDGPIKYIPYYYGPYSFEVAQTINNLVSSGVIKEKKEIYDTNTTPWGEATRYSYSIDSDLKETINSFLKQILGNEEYEILKGKLFFINSKNDSNDYQALSIAAKVFQILKNKNTIRISEFSSEAKKLNWKLNSKEVEKALKFIKEIDLIQ